MLKSGVPKERGHEVETMTGKVIGFKEWRKDHEKWPHGNPDDPVMEKYRDGP